MSICKRGSFIKVQQYRNALKRSGHHQYLHNAVAQCCMWKHARAFELVLTVIRRCVVCLAPVVDSTKRRTAVGSGATMSWMRRARKAKLQFQLCG